MNRTGEDWETGESRPMGGQSNKIDWIVSIVIVALMLGYIAYNYVEIPECWVRLVKR